MKLMSEDMDKEATCSSIG